MIHYLIFNLIVAHILGDFYLQTKNPAKTNSSIQLKVKVCGCIL